MFSYLGLALIYLGTMRSLLPLPTVTITHTDLKTPTIHLFMYVRIKHGKYIVIIYNSNDTYTTCNLMFVCIHYLHK